jgi:hypothetical protein
MHHGKNKRDHDASDPGDMIAGTTGLGAGAMTTISLLPLAVRRGEETDDVEGPKRRELYVHGRLTRKKRLLIEQDEKTGLWKCGGDIVEQALSEVREAYFEALMSLGAQEHTVSAEDVSKEMGRRRDTVHKVLRRMARGAAVWSGLRVIVQHGRGYRLVG